MRLTEEQKQAIIADAAKHLEKIAEDPLDGRDDLDLDEDEYGRCYNRGTCSLCGTYEEICEEDGIPGILPEESEIYISMEYDGTAYFHDEYDPGDYWTPPSGGIELDDFDLHAISLSVEIDVLNKDTDEYESVEVSDEELNEMMDAINSIAGVERKPRKSRKSA